jgi:hypothetical protein
MAMILAKVCHSPGEYFFKNLISLTTFFFSIARLNSSE